MSNNEQSNNLNELLKAGGYDEDAEGESAAVPPYFAELSKPMIRRVRALKKNQLESLQIETRFYQRVHELEKEFQPLFDTVNAKRRAIITGEHEPTDDEVEFPLLDEVSSELLEKIEQVAPVENGTPTRGIPDFWFHTLNNVAQINETIKAYDEPILKYLVDLTSEVHTEPPGFTLRFHFGENPYFQNKVLTKYYQLDIELDEEEPFEYDGPEIVKGVGCEIQWKEGKNVTQKVVKKKQKTGKFTSKTVSQESFFNFFNPGPRTIDETMEPEQQDVECVWGDFEIGQFIQDHVVPRAVLFYTGEATDADEYEEDDDDKKEEKESSESDDLLDIIEVDGDQQQQSNGAGEDED